MSLMKVDSSVRRSDQLCLMARWRTIGVLADTGKVSNWSGNAIDNHDWHWRGDLFKRDVYLRSSEGSGFTPHQYLYSITNVSKLHKEKNKTKQKWKSIYNIFSKLFWVLLYMEFVLIKILIILNYTNSNESVMWYKTNGINLVNHLNKLNLY